MFTGFKARLCIPEDSSMWKCTDGLLREAGIKTCPGVNAPQQCRLEVLGKYSLILVIHLKYKWSIAGWLGMWAKTALDRLHPCESVFCRLPFLCSWIGHLSMTLSSCSKSSIPRTLAMSGGSFLWVFNFYMKDTSAKICLYQKNLCKILSYLHSIYFPLNAWDTP